MRAAMAIRPTRRPIDATTPVHGPPRVAAVEVHGRGRRRPQRCSTSSAPCQRSRSSMAGSPRRGGRPPRSRRRAPRCSARSSRWRRRRGAIRAEYDRDGDPRGARRRPDRPRRGHDRRRTDRAADGLRAQRRVALRPRLGGQRRTPGRRRPGHLHHGHDRRRDGRRALAVPQLDELPRRRRARRRPAGSTIPTSTWRRCAWSATTSCRRGTRHAQPTRAEIRKTMVIAVPLVEMSAKIRAGDPIDEPEDLDGPHWAGHVPIRSVWEPPVPAGDLPAGIAVPAGIAAPRRAARVTRTQPRRPVGRPPRRPGARAVHRQPRAALVDDDRRVVRHHRSSTLWITCRAAVQGLAPPARRSRTSGRRCSSSTTPSPWPPATARARRAAAPTTSPTATPSTAPAAGARKAGELDRRLAAERLRRGPRAVAGRDRPLWAADARRRCPSAPSSSSTAARTSSGRPTLQPFAFAGWGPPSSAGRPDRSHVLTPPTSVAALRRRLPTPTLAPAIGDAGVAQPLAPPVKFHDARRSAGAVHHGIVAEYVSPGSGVADARRRRARRPASAPAGRTG